MPTYEITTPQGTFHVDADDESALPGVISQLGGQAAQAPAASQDNGTGPSFGERFLHGVDRPLLGAAELAAHAFPQGLPAPNPYMGMVPTGNAQDLSNAIAGDESAFQAQRAAGGQTGPDWAGILGTTAATAPLALVGGPGMGASVATGAVNGLLEPAADPTGEYWTQKAKEAGIGGLTSGLFKAATSAIAPAVSGAKQALIDRGIPLTPGQLLGPTWATMEDKLSGVPLLGGLIKGAQSDAVRGFNTSLYNAALAPIGQKSTAGAGRAGVDEVATKLGAAYDDLLPKLTFTPDTQFAGDVANVAQGAGGLSPDKLGRFQWFWQNKVAPRLQSGTLDGDQIKAMQNEFNGEIAQWRGSPSADDQLLANSLDGLRGAFMDGVERSNPAALSGQLANINTGYALYTRIRDAAQRAGTDSGVFTPAQYLAAVRGGDTSVGNGAFARGKALDQTFAEQAKDVIGNRYPDSGTAGRLQLPAMIAGAVKLGVNPYLAAGIGAATLPYSSFGQKALNAFVSPAPWRQQLGNVADYAALPLGAFGTAALLANGGP